MPESAGAQTLQDTYAQGPLRPGAAQCLERPSLSGGVHLRHRRLARISTIILTLRRAAQENAFLHSTTRCHRKAMTG